MVGNRHMPAGTYDITSGQSTLLVRGEDNGSASFAIAISAYAGKTQEQAKLVFKRYGDRYFLSQVWYPGTDQGRQLQVSKVERELAMNSAKPEIVTLLASVPRAQRAAK
jgi:thymidylate kinase